MAAAKINMLSKIYGIFPYLVRWIQVAEVPSVALCGAEIWWRNRKNYLNEKQKLINQQACLITEMYLWTPIFALMSESGWILANVLLDFRKRNYPYRLLSLLYSIPTKDIFLITLRVRDRNAQPDDQRDQDYL